MLDAAGWAAILTAIAALITAVWQARKTEAEARRLRHATRELGRELHPDPSGGTVREALERIETLSSEAAAAARNAQEDQAVLRRDVHGIRGELRQDREAVQLIRLELTQLREAVTRHLGPFRRRWGS